VLSVNNILFEKRIYFGRASALIITILFLLTLPACVSNLVANQMVGAPNKSLIGYELSNQFSAFDIGHTGLLNIDGVNQSQQYLPTRKINISFLDIAAADYGFSYSTKAVLHKNGKIRHITSDWQWFNNNCKKPSKKSNTSKTIVLLHGWGRSKNSLLSYGLAFAQQGYRVIIPDLRGHGNSSGDWVSFGAEEGRDISALMDLLAIKKYDLVGFSLGASAGLHATSLDERVNKLVVIAPMHSLAETIPKFARQAPDWLEPIVTNHQIEALALANSLSGYSYEKTSNSIAPAKLISKPVLFVYGSIDKMSDYPLNKLLFEQGSKSNQLHQLNGLRHTHVLLHQSALMPSIYQWLGINTFDSNNTAIEGCTFHNFHH